MMKKACLFLMVLVAFSVAAQAALVPNGDFALYNAAGSRSVSVGSNIWVQTIGMDRPLAGGHAENTVTFADGTSAAAGDGQLVNIPGWITGTIESPGYPEGTNEGPIANAADLFSPGIDAADGTSCANVFGSWSGQNGGLLMTDADLELPVLAAGEVIQISAMLQGDPAPYIFDLYVDGVKIEPDLVSDPATTAWRKIRRTYFSVPEGDVRILIGTPKAKEDPDVTLTGSRLKIDNVAINAVPEPATMALLGLGGLALLRRRK